MAKQNEVTAASMVRRAKAHRECAASNRRAKVGRSASKVDQLEASALTHEQTAAILRAEAKEIRGHR